MADLIASGVRVQRHLCQAIGLIGHAPIEAAILDHDVGRDMAPSLDLFPSQIGGRVADLAGLLRQALQPVAGSAVPQNEPPLIEASQKGLLKESGTWISFGIVSLRAPSNPATVHRVLAADELDIGRAT